MIRQNWGNLDEVPFVEVEIPRPQRDQEMANRDKLLFCDMGLPVSLQYLYERHRVPSPDPDGVLFQPPQARTSPGPVVVSKHSAPSCACAVDARSEGNPELTLRQYAALAAFPRQLADAEAAGDYLVWNTVLDQNTTVACRARHGRRWGDGWFDPPPIHYNCRSTLVRIPKADYVSPGS